MLAARIHASLPLVIKPNQTGFVEGKSILDNIFLPQEALDWATGNDQDFVLFLLDLKRPSTR
jgi:hypothetical protein